MHPVYYGIAAVFWLLVILRWRYGVRAKRRAALHSVIGGIRRDKSERGFF